jgi:flagellar protein FlbD
MIRLSRLNHTEIIVNTDHILTLESTPDTIVTLTNGDKIMVTEGVDQIIEMFVEFRKRILSGPTIIPQDSTP